MQYSFALQPYIESSIFTYLVVTRNELLLKHAKSPNNTNIFGYQV
jgi:hypothetical protein